VTHSNRNENRFQDFFEDTGYVALKNHLYNYRLRKRAVERMFRGESPSLILEVGSGMSPVIGASDRVVYSELSPLACATLKRLTPQGWHVGADATRLPFGAGVFSHAIASEVIEHIEDDRAALRELARVLRPGGRLVLTIPHRRAYFGVDDRYVRHWRRYDWNDMVERLDEAGLRPVHVKKVLGPFEKLVMSMAVRCFERLTRSPSGSGRGRSQSTPSALALAGNQHGRRYWHWIVPLWDLGNTIAALIAACDASVTPRRWASVLIVVAEKN